MDPEFHVKLSTSPFMTPQGSGQAVRFTGVISGSSEGSLFTGTLGDPVQWSMGRALERDPSEMFTARCKGANSGEDPLDRVVSADAAIYPPPLCRCPPPCRWPPIAEQRNMAPLAAAPPPLQM